VKRAVVLAFALLTASSLMAQGIAEGKWWKRPRIAQELALSPEQTEKLETIFAAAKPNLIDRRADFEKKQFDYEQAMESDTVDRKALEAKIEAREQSRAALQKELALMELDMKAVLTPAQREKLVRMRERARAMIQKRRRQMRDGAAADFDDAPTPPPRRRTPA